MNALEFLSALIENPYSKKAYKDFKAYLETKNMSHEAAAIQALIEKRFNNDHSTPNDKKQ